MITGTKFGLSVVVLSTAMGMTALAQSATQATPAAQDTSSSASASSKTMSVDDSSTYATGKPLEQQSKEGFWGHLNPLARKKWVHRQVDPIKDRTNELDQLQSKNANDIRDVDSRATAGINKAQSAAELADQHAAAAANRAGEAQQLANNASTRTTSLNTTVSNLDQYQEISSASVPFASGRTSLGPKGKATLDDVVAKLANEKGYIVEVQGYSRNGVQTSQAMADSVVRYLVTEHQVPVYRVYRTGLGRASAQQVNGEKAITNGVRVTLLHNSLATMDTNAASNSVPVSPQSSTTGVSAPPEANQ
ncbi:OmpA family protein [Edaphobacter sp. 12200R-103]|jgi:outer membrane protein OmpA-like peptidoglycan-associated protein|uniref:OmpA family protein n=1 Tax=Edaphobacter sp. 12200R-103 TaxID=2703788 RepID=UPI00138DC7F7|nr:OmpA family protein [Edaphobacter sp. 12200R-103]QHS52024.1 flagellar motor protein MotB [Edaphobacter sp. 12200R-103]